MRGYRESRLGPKDSFGNPYGGNMKVVSQLELLLPMPEKWRNSARFSMFFDIGNVFSTGDVDFVGIDGVTPVDYKFGFDKLRALHGCRRSVARPAGCLPVQLCVPAQRRAGQDVVPAGSGECDYGDETEGFQFSIGQAF